MELWIRTQSKQSLVKVDNVSITEQPTKRYIVDSGNWILGRYNSFERALEILDEIQKILHPKMIMESNGGAFVSGDNNLHIINPTYQEIEQLDTIVYEMPEE